MLHGTLDFKIIQLFECKMKLKTKNKQIIVYFDKQNDV